MNFCQPKKCCHATINYFSTLHHSTRHARIVQVYDDITDDMQMVSCMRLPQDMEEATNRKITYKAVQTTEALIKGFVSYVTT